MSNANEDWGRTVDDPLTPSRESREQAAVGFKGYPISSLRCLRYLEKTNISGILEVAITENGQQRQNHVLKVFLPQKKNRESHMVAAPLREMTVIRYLNQLSRTPEETNVGTGRLSKQMLPPETQVVKCIGYIQFKDTIGILLEKLNGSNLRDYLCKSAQKIGRSNRTMDILNSSFQPEDHLALLYKLNWTIQMLNVLVWLHSNRISHGDISESNFMFRDVPSFNSFGEIVLCDFGNASRWRRHGVDEDVDLLPCCLCGSSSSCTEHLRIDMCAREGLEGGTEGFMSPEVYVCRNVELRTKQGAIHPYKCSEAFERNSSKNIPSYVCRCSRCECTQGKSDVYSVGVILKHMFHATDHYPSGNIHNEYGELVSSYSLAFSRREAPSSSLEESSPPPPLECMLSDVLALIDSECLVRYGMSPSLSIVSRVSSAGLTPKLRSRETSSDMEQFSPIIGKLLLSAGEIEPDYQRVIAEFSAPETPSVHEETAAKETESICWKKGGLKKSPSCLVELVLPEAAIQRDHLEKEDHLLRRTETSSSSSTDVMSPLRTSKSSQNQMIRSFLTRSWSETISPMGGGPIFLPNISVYMSHRATWVKLSKQIHREINHAIIKSLSIDSYNRFTSQQLLSIFQNLFNIVFDFLVSLNAI